MSADNARPPVVVGDPVSVYKSLQREHTGGLRIAWAPFAHPDAPSGYGVIAGKLASALSSAGCDVLDHSELGWKVAVAVSLPTAWPFPGGKPRGDMCWHTMYDCDPLPTGWADVLNLNAAVWVPSVWVRDLFLDNGVTVPIFVSGYGVDVTLFHPMGRKKAGEGPMKFLAWGTGFTGRKNLIPTIKAFLAAGLPEKEATLEVKVNLGGGAPIFKDDEGRPFSNVKVVEGNWQVSKVAEWLRTGDVLIYLSSGEGFGLQPLEAMACGCAVICADNTGMREYLRAEVALPVVCRDREVSKIYSMRFPGGPFYQYVPNQDHAIAHIRWCWEHQIEAAKVGRTAAAYVADKWSWGLAGVRAKAALEARFG